MKLRKLYFYSRAWLGLEGGSPDFIIIGAQKCGTSSLIRYIFQSSEFARPTGRKLHFFENNYEKSIDYYRKHFPHIRKGSHRFTGEASASYIYYKEIPERVALHFPDIKLIAILRDPVARALSHFNHNKRKSLHLVVDGRKIESFDEYISLVIDDMDGRNEGRLYSDQYDLVERGFYKEQIERWFACFGREQFHFVKFEDFAENPQSELDKVMDFLGKSRFSMPRNEVHNSGGDYSRKMSEETFERLASLYREHNRGLSELIDCDLSDWSYARQS